MTFQVSIRPEAETDINDAYTWLEEQKIGLGKDFILCVDASIQSIIKTPHLFSKVYEQIHRCLIRRFPYGVYYFISENTVIVIGVLHARRNPAIWKNRKHKRPI